jgi:hypothetical protein
MQTLKRLAKGEIERCGGCRIRFRLGKAIFRRRGKNSFERQNSTVFRAAAKISHGFIARSSLIAERISMLFGSFDERKYLHEKLAKTSTQNPWRALELLKIVFAKISTNVFLSKLPQNSSTLALTRGERALK